MDDGTQSPQVAQFLPEWNLEAFGKFALGSIVGAAVESTGNIENGCLADLASLTTSGYHIYYYMNDYATSNDELALAWSITYMVKGFDVWFKIRCGFISDFTSGLTSDVSGDPPKAESSRPSVMNHDEDFNNGKMPEDQEQPWYDDNSNSENQVANWTNALFKTIYEVISSLEYAIGGIEVFINTSEFIGEYEQGNYFQSGYFFGSGIFGTFFLWYDLFIAYANNLMSSETTTTTNDDGTPHDDGTTNEET